MRLKETDVKRPPSTFNPSSTQMETLKGSEECLDSQSVYFTVVGAS